MELFGIFFSLSGSPYFYDLLHKNDKDIVNLLCQIYYHKLPFSGHTFRHRPSYFKQNVTEILAPLKDVDFGYQHLPFISISLVLLRVIFMFIIMLTSFQEGGRREPADIVSCLDVRISGSSALL